VKASRGFVRFCVLALIFHFLSSNAIRAQQSGGSASPIDSKSYAGMKWRLIGPFRGGRVTAVAKMTGVAGGSSVRSKSNAAPSCQGRARESGRAARQVWQ
jgi:ABC-type cobalamin transport system ATPase subunit